MNHITRFSTGFFLRRFFVVCLSISSFSDPKCIPISSSFCRLIFEELESRCSVEEAGGFDGDRSMETSESNPLFLWSGATKGLVPSPAYLRFADMFFGILDGLQNTLLLQ